MISEMNGAFQSQVAMLQVLYGERLLRAKMLKARKNARRAFFQTQQARYFVSTKTRNTPLGRGTPLQPRLCKKEMKKTRPKEQYETRDIIEKFRVNKEEAELIDIKFRNSGYKSKSDFFRIMIFQGQIIKVSDEYLSDFRRKYTSVSNNINQIALRLNASGNIYAEDIAEIKNGVSEIWQQLNYFRSVLLKVKPSPTLPAQQKPTTDD